VGAMAVAIDAIIINTDGLSLDNVVKQILKFACDRGLISD
jgi:cytidylate kinase